MASNNPVTEIALLNLKAGIDVTDESNSAHQVWQDTLFKIAAQFGFQRAYYGTQLEDPSILQLVIGAFALVPKYQPI